jgi:sec-independent protein translocase protein TatB
MFFNVGGAEVLVIAVIALIAVGPEQLPGVLRKLGRTMGQMRSMAAGLRDEFMAGANELGDVADPDSWFGGAGRADDPVVRRGPAGPADDGDKTSTTEPSRSEPTGDKTSTTEPSRSEPTGGGGSTGVEPSRAGSGEVEGDGSPAGTGAVAGDRSSDGDADSVGPDEATLGDGGGPAR